ncbi:TPA: multidrug effflux MFS transporter [Klebsiella michiganensis]|nr:multidrug effflux MFS transporter [Klebsiella michiganensis]
MKQISFTLVTILGALTALGPICTDFYLPALPELRDELEIDTTLAQMSLTASLIGLGIGQLVFGPISDRTGRKLPLMISLFVFVISSILCATAENGWMLVFYRFIQGVAGGGGAVLSRSIARDRYTGVELTQFFALLMAINGVAPIFSPVIGGYISAFVGWRVLFLTMAAMGVFLLLACYFLLSESVKQKNQSFSYFADACVLLKDRHFSIYCFVQAFMFMGFFSYVGSSSFVLQNEYKISSFHYSLMFGINGVGVVLTSMIFSKLSVRYGLDNILNKGLVTAVIFSMILVTSIVTHSSPVICFILLFFTISFNSGICTLASSVAMSNVSGEYSGTASALLGVSMFLFGGLATPLSAIGGESMLKMCSAIFVSYLLALLINMIKR